MDRWRDEPEMRLTLALLAGGGCLIAAGSAGVAASVVLALGLVVVATLLRAVGQWAVETEWTRLDRHEFVADLWVGPGAAAVIVLVALDATPGEVQALGGLVGLLGMANYFLRPIYRALYGLARRLARL